MIPHGGSGCDCVCGHIALCFDVLTDSGPAPHGTWWVVGVFHPSQ